MGRPRPSGKAPVERRERLTLGLVLASAAALFLLNLHGYDLWAPDEPRFAEIARELRLSGDPIVLRVNGEFYKEKPPLLFWLIATASVPVTAMSPFVEAWSLAARLPSALAALITVGLTMLLARRLFDGRTAAWAGAVLATMGLFWWEARSVRTDMPLTACTTAALYAFWRHHESKDFRWLPAFYAAIAAALFTKGPPGLVFPLLLAIAFYWGHRGKRRRLHLVVGLLIAAAPVLAWFILASIRGAGQAPQPEEAAAGVNLFRQTIGRFFLGVSKAQWPWYYLEVLPLDLFPWTIFLPWTLVWTWRHRHDGPPMRLLLSWIVPAFVFFSVSIGKRAVYLVPLYPAFAILFARSILDLMESDRVRWRRVTATVWGVILLLFAAAPFAILFTEYRDSCRNEFLVVTAVAALFGLDALRRAGFTEARDSHKVVWFQFGGLLLLAALILLPAVNPHKSARYITTPLRNLSAKGAQYRLYSVGFSREEYVFYSQHFHEPVLTDLLPVDLPNPPDLARMARLQKDLKKEMIDAVGEVPVASFQDVTDEEIAALRNAVERAVAEAEVDPEFAAAFERALTRAISDFIGEFESEGPAYFFVEEQDWRWLLALYPDFRDYRVLRHQPVGSRRVLLISNEVR